MLCPPSPSDSGQAGAPEDQIEITPEMTKAGMDVFYEDMLANDYLASAPSDAALSSMIARIFSSMLAYSPEVRRKDT